VVATLGETAFQNEARDSPGDHRGPAAHDAQGTRDAYEAHEAHEAHEADRRDPRRRGAP
jgi:hypothetical protein